MNTNEIFKSYNDNILLTYTRMPAIFVKGQGSVLTDINGKKYLDFFPGWGVNNLGHCHPQVVAAVREQVGRLIHIPNNLYNPFQAELAKKLVRLSFPGKIFFCNSGAEANEAAIKFARAYGQGKKFEIITTLNSFHGRTLGSLTATGQLKHQHGFEPLLPGFKYVPFNDLKAMKAAITPKTVAIMLELIQGEGGIIVASKKYLQALRKICDNKKILLIFDEVQTGIGRTGEMFCYQHFGVTPDIMTLAKALGGGLPIGAMIVKKQLAAVFKPGMHGSTFAGSPLVCQAALAVINSIQSEKIFRQVKQSGPYLLSKLEQLKKKYSIIRQVRGLGLMIGVELSTEGKEIFNQCFKHGLIINCTQGNILRIMPALNVTKKQIDQAMVILDKAFQTVTSK